MSKARVSELDEQFSRFEPHLPPRLGKAVRWLRQPSSLWVRVPAALILIGGGIFGFLPVLGFWMVPLGLIVLSHDIPAVRRRRRRIAVWWNRRKDAPKADRRG